MANELPDASEIGTDDRRSGRERLASVCVLIVSLNFRSSMTMGPGERTQARAEDATAALIRPTMPARAARYGRTVPRRVQDQNRLNCSTPRPGAVSIIIPCYNGER